MKKALRIVLNVIAWMVVVVAVLMTVLVFTSRSDTGISSLFGKMPVTVQSESMKPTFNKGDLIIDRALDDASALKEGDIITFWTLIENKKVLNTHKIVQVLDNGGSLRTFVTKGDNNTAEDELTVHPSDIVGVYTGVRLPGCGKVLDFLKSPTGFLLCIVVPLVLFFLYEVYRFIAVILSLKKPKLTAEEEEEIKRQAVAEYLAGQNGAETEAPEMPAEERDEITR